MCLESLGECIILLRKKIDLKVPTTMEEWVDIPRCEMDIRRSFVVEDAVREQFDPNKLIKVFIDYHIPGRDDRQPALISMSKMWIGRISAILFYYYYFFLAQ